MTKWLLVLAVCLSVQFLAAQEQLQVGTSLRLDAEVYGKVTTSTIDPDTNIGFFGTDKGFVIKVDLSTAFDGASSDTVEYDPLLNETLQLTVPNNLNISSNDTVGKAFPLVGAVFDRMTKAAYFFQTYSGGDPKNYLLFRVSVYPNLSYDETEDVLPYAAFGFTTVHVAFIDDEVERMVYVLGSPTNNLEEDTTTSTFFARIPLDFDVANPSVEEDLKIDDDSTAFVSSGFVDIANGVGYFAREREPVILYKVNLMAHNMTGLIIATKSLPAVDKVKGAVYDSIRGIGYFYTADQVNQTSRIVKVNVTNFEDWEFNAANDTYTLRNNFKAVNTAVIDVVGGQVYLGSNVPSESKLIHFQLPQFSPRGEAALAPRGVDVFVTSFIDNQNKYAYFGAASTETDYTYIVRAVLPDACPKACSGHGNCSYGACICGPIVPQSLFPHSPGWGGDACTDVRCPEDCNNHGTCNGFTGNCTCRLNYQGDSCANFVCSDDCNGRGTCNPTLERCECIEGWEGVACEQESDVPCYLRTSCSSCMQNDSCGWCETAGSCHEGTLDGPLDGGCMSWYYETCPQLGLQFWAFLFSGFCAILLLINMVSVVIEDKEAPSQKPSDVEIRASWWRNQRSAKTWVMIDQAQFAACTGMFAVSSPSLYYNFVTVYRWAVIGFGLPWNVNKVSNDRFLTTPSATSTRHLLSMEQYTSSLISYDGDLLFGQLFWLAILIGILLATFILIFIFGSKNKNIAKMVKNRPIYTLIRIALFAYFPLAIIASFSLTQSKESAGAAVAGAIVLVALLGMMVWVYLLLPLRDTKKSTKLFSPNFLKKFGCIYNSYYFKRSWYMEVHLLKKLLLGLAIGLLYKWEVAQLVVIEVILAAYLISVFLLKPYLDHIHAFLDLMCTFGNMIVTGIMFAFVDGATTDETIQIILSAVTAAFLLMTQILCMAAFINSWMKLANIHGVKQLVACCRGKHQNNQRDSSLEIDNHDIELHTAKAD